MFLVFVVATLGITKWAAGKTKTTADFYTAGGGITGFQNGLAIAGDYMSAATLLGLTSMVYFKGYDGFIYAVCFFIGWPIILFLMAERLRNLGKFTFADIASYRLDQNRIRTFAAIGSLTVVCFYLIVQMVGAGQLIQLLFGLEYNIAVVVVGLLMMVYVTFGGMTATTWVQIIKACLLLGGGITLMLLTLSQFGWSLDNLFSKAIESHKLGEKMMAPGFADGRSGLRLLAVARPALRYRRPAAHHDALLHRAERQGSPQVGVLRHRLHRPVLPRHHGPRCRRRSPSSAPTPPSSKAARSAAS